MAADSSTPFPADASHAADVPETSTFGTATASTAGAATATSTTSGPTGTYFGSATSSSSKPSPPPMGASSQSRSRLRPARGGLRRLINSLVRIVDLQYRIWLTQAKVTLQRMMLYAALFLGAFVLGLLAIIFLYIGLFRVLTDVIGVPIVWAFLIFGGLHLVLALALVMVGTSILGKKDKDDEDKQEDKEKKQQEKHDSRQAQTGHV